MPLAQTKLATETMNSLSILQKEANSNGTGFSLDRVMKIPKDLPDALRTHHWYNDLHHAMFLILFVNAFNALKKSSTSTIENYVDNITIYLFVHFLMEEEGMVFSVKHHGLCGDAVHAHARTHVHFVRWWNENVYKTFKAAPEDRVPVHEAMLTFCEQLIDHIDTVDMKTYGLAQRTEKISRNEIAHMSRCGLPLSPFMPGALKVMELLAPTMFKRLNPASVSPAAEQPLSNIRLMEPNKQLWDGDKGAFRDVFLAATMGHRPQSLI